MSPLSVLSFSENEHLQENNIQINEGNTYRNNNNSDKGSPSTRSSERRTKTKNSFQATTTPTTDTDIIPNNTTKEQIGFYFVIFFNEASPFLHSSNILEGKRANNIVSSSTTPKENTVENDTFNEHHNSKTEELFPEFLHHSNNNNCEGNEIREHITYFRSVFSAKDEVPHRTLHSIAIPAAFDCATNELELVLTSLEQSSENIIDKNGNNHHQSANYNELQYSKCVPCNFKIHQVHDDNGVVCLTHIILTSTFNIVRVKDLTQIENKRVAVALVLACPPSRSVEYAFLLSHVHLLKSCLHKLIYFAMRTMYRYFNASKLFTRFTLTRQQENIKKLCCILAECEDAIVVHKMIKEDLNNGLHIRFPLPFIGFRIITTKNNDSTESANSCVVTDNTEHVYLPLLWESANVQTEEEEQHHRPSLLIERLRETIKVNISIKVNNSTGRHNAQNANLSSNNKKKSNALLSAGVTVSSTLSSALYEALEYILEFDASFASAFVISLLSLRFRRTFRETIGNNICEIHTKEEEQLEHHKAKCNNINKEYDHIDDNDDDVYKTYWETRKKEYNSECSLPTRATSSTEAVDTKEENVQVIVVCSNNDKLALSLLLIAAFFWHPELSDIAQPTYCTETAFCTSSSSSSSSSTEKEKEEYTEREVQRSFINAIAGLVSQSRYDDNKKNENYNTKKFTQYNTLISVPIQWKRDSELNEALYENNVEANFDENYNNWKESSELEQIKKYINPYSTFDKLYLVKPHKHTCQEIQVQRGISATVTVNMNASYTASKTDQMSKRTHCHLVHNPFQCNVKSYKYIKANSEMINLLRNALITHRKTNGVLPVTLTLPRMMYWWQTQQQAACTHRS